MISIIQCNLIVLRKKESSPTSERKLKEIKKREERGQGAREGMRDAEREPPRVISHNSVTREESYRQNPMFGEGKKRGGWEAHPGRGE